MLMGNVFVLLLSGASAADVGLVSQTAESFSIETSDSSADRLISYRPPKDIGRPRRTWPSGGRAV